MTTKQIAVLDFETDPFEYEIVPEPFACGIYLETDHDEYYYEFYNNNSKELLFEVYKFLKDKDWRVYAHNGGKFDFFFLLKYIDELNVIGGRIATAKMGECILVDSYLLLPLPLSSYKKDDIDYRIFTKELRDIEENKKEILKYLFKDCVYLYEWIIEWKNNFGITLTLATAAFQQVKATGYKIKKHRNINWDDKFRPFYFGGRTEVFKSGVIDKKLEYIDINSAYPAAMLHPHPYGRDLHYQDYFPDEGVYFAEIVADSRGALPIRADNGGLSFPIGINHFYASSWEIEKGLETNTIEILDIKKVYVPQEVKSFKDFVLKWYEIKLKAKLDGDKTREQFAKLILNSAYGKFALNPRKFKQYEIMESGKVPDIDPEKSIDWEIIFDNFDYSIFQAPDPSDEFYNVLTAASITGFVRAFLWGSIQVCENPVYCDTDSIVCEKAHVKMSNELGDWKLEANINKAYIGGKKMYCFETDDGEFKTASKGARLTPDEIKRVVSGEVINWKNEAPSFSLRNSVRFINRDIRTTK